MQYNSIFVKKLLPSIFLLKLELEEAERLVDEEERNLTNAEHLNALYHKDLLTILFCNIRALNGRFQ